MLRLLAVSAVEEKGQSLWLIDLVVGIAGAIAGALNALISERAVVVPNRLPIGGMTVWQPGWIGSVAAGFVAAAGSWALYGPASTAVLLSTKPANAGHFALSLSAIVGAALVGFGAARWLSAEADKKIAQANTAVVAERMNVPEPEKARIRNGSPREAAEALNALA